MYGRKNEVFILSSMSIYNDAADEQDERNQHSQGNQCIPTEGFPLVAPILDEGFEFLFVNFPLVL